MSSTQQILCAILSFQFLLQSGTAAQQIPSFPFNNHIRGLRGVGHNNNNNNNNNNNVPQEEGPPHMVEQRTLTTYSGLKICAKLSSKNSEDAISVEIDLNVSGQQYSCSVNFAAGAADDTEECCSIGGTVSLTSPPTGSMGLAVNNKDGKGNPQEIVLKGLAIQDNAGNELLYMGKWYYSSSASGGNKCGLSDKIETCGGQHGHKHMGLGHGECLSADVNLEAMSDNCSDYFEYNCWEDGDGCKANN